MSDREVELDKYSRSLQLHKWVPHKRRILHPKIHTFLIGPLSGYRAPYLPLHKILTTLLNLIGQSLTVTANNFSDGDSF